MFYNFIEINTAALYDKQDDDDDFEEDFNTASLKPMTDKMMSLRFTEKTNTSSPRSLFARSKPSSP